MNETILQILREAGMKATRQRESILSIFLEADTRLTAEDLFLRLRERNEEYSLATVDRTLSALAERHVLERGELPDHSCQCYNLAHQGHRHQLTCIRCHKTLLLDECPGEEFLEEVGRRHGFRVTGHSFEVFGICPACQKEEKS